MPISESEKKYLESILDALGEIAIQYRLCEDETEKAEIKEKYENLSSAYKKLVDELLVRDLTFSDEDIDSIKEIGTRISQAATVQQLLVTVAELTAKFVV